MSFIEHLSFDLLVLSTGDSDCSSFQHVNYHCIKHLKSVV